MDKKDFLNHFSQWKDICDSPCLNEYKPSHAQQKIEVFHFINPLCPECWGIEPHIKKLQIEYGHILKLRPFLTGNISELNASTNPQKKRSLANHWERTSSRTGMVCTGALWLKDPIKRPFILSLSMKAAELQGQKLGNRFSRILREKIFIETKNVERKHLLLECAKEAGLDIDEFFTDLHSESAAKALQCDFTIAKDFDVQVLPTLIFFHHNIEEPGIKVSGYQDFNVYERIIEDLLGGSVQKTPLPPICYFVKKFKLFALKEVCTVYDISPETARNHLLPMVIRGVLKEHHTPLGYYYKYIYPINENKSERFK